MKKYSAKINVIFSIIIIVGIFGLTESSEAANHYVRSGATGGNGSNWVEAYSSLPSTLVRGDTYYIADGTYSSYSFNDTESGSLYITIKKATVADHGTDTGWQNSYGDGQAVLGSFMSLAAGYYVINGNGTHTFPSDDTNDYGFKINSNTTSNNTGIVKIGVSKNVTNITLKYIHIYNTYHSANGATDVRSIVSRSSGFSSYIKIQNCFVENSGKDGIVMDKSNHWLIERSYMKRLGKKLTGSPDTHGQALRGFVGNNNDIIMRWNVFESNEGQSLFAFDCRQLSGCSNIRFYGNVVFTGYGVKNTYGYNVGGGVIGNAWGGTTDGVFVYNNTVVNLNDQQSLHTPVGSHFKVVGSATNIYGHNNLFYNSKDAYFSGSDVYSHNASGGGGIAGGSNEQTGLSSSIFTNYNGNDFALSSPTTAGLTLSDQGWWDDSVDSFFGQLDYYTDILGNIRGADGTWDIGAYEFDPVGFTQPSPPNNLHIVSSTP